MNNYAEDRPIAVCDTETYVNYFSIGFKSAADGRVRVFEKWNDSPLDRKSIATIFRKWRVVGFNFKAYDIPMILYAMSGATNGELKRASDELIQYGVPWWTLLDRLGLTVPDFFDCIDLMSVSPGAPQMPSLKIYAGRMHSRKMQELPIEVDDRIDENKIEVLRAYQGNDLDVTHDMLDELRAQLQLRAMMSVEYGVDLRSKSDAQIAEAVIKIEIERATGRKLHAPDVEPGYFSYEVPDFVRFQTPTMRKVLDDIRRTKFIVDRSGVVKMPEVLKDLAIKLGHSTYRMGIGGLHSSETRSTHYSDDRFVLLDRDVTSYYPMIILRSELYPKHIGPHFLKIYSRIFARRIAAKKSGDKNTAESLKLTLNGSFGKFGSPFSTLYSPNLMIQTTLTGQLSILMLIEELEERMINVVSANTDGFVTKVPRDCRDEFNQACTEWERQTGFSLEETEYRSLHSRDVNTYCAIAIEDGKVKAKLKGAFAPSGRGLPGAAGLKKNPDMDICTEAVVEYLKHGTPIEETIEWCTDPRKFLTVRRVTGGAVDQDGVEIGTALRWYYSKEVSGGFKYKKNGNSVPQTIGAKTMMELLPYVPHDIDYDYYVREAYAILQDVGVKSDDPRLRGRSGRMIARLPDQKTYHVVDVSRDVALCGKSRDSIRDSWIEAEEQPEGRAMCGKCKKEMR